ncbi:hypothetical protein Tco_0562616 [Tanacetum coccineum]
MYRNDAEMVMGGNSLGPGIGYSFIEDQTTKGMGLRVEDSHTGNHREDGFTPLETIRRFLGMFGSRSHTSSKGRPSSRRGGRNEQKLSTTSSSESLQKLSAMALLLTLGSDPITRLGLGFGTGGFFGGGGGGYVFLGHNLKLVFDTLD